MDKCSIYKARCEGVRLRIETYVSIVKLYRNIEKYNAIATNSLDKYLLKWEGVELGTSNSFVEQYISNM